MAQLAALGRIGEPEDIARVVCFLASEEAGWISGQNLGANGGLAKTLVNRKSPALFRVE
jgi:3-oxoacyl-[acyl-carrier protein] reductase